MDALWPERTLCIESPTGNQFVRVMSYLWIVIVHEQELN